MIQKRTSSIYFDVVKKRKRTTICFKKTFSFNVLVYSSFQFFVIFFIQMKILSYFKQQYNHHFISCFTLRSIIEQCPSIQTLLQCPMLFVLRDSLCICLLCYQHKSLPHLYVHAKLYFIECIQKSMFKKTKNE